MRLATVEKEWAEVIRNGEKTEDWSWTVTFYEGEYIEMNDWIDRHYIKTEVDAEMIALLFEADAFNYTEYGGLTFRRSFEDYYCPADL
jgi:hypothetical protein